MNFESEHEVCEKESSVPPDDLVELGSVSDGTKGNTLGQFFDGHSGRWG